MSEAWVVVAALGAITIVFKAAGPVILGGRSLPPRAVALVEAVAPAMLAALVVTQAVGGDRELVFDERLVGLGAAAVALRFRAPILGVVVTAAVATALARAL